MLAALGVNEAAERVYRAMLAQPDQDMAEIAGQLELTEAQVRAALEELFALSLVRESLDRPGRPRALEPDVGLQAALALQHEELVRRQQQAAASHAVVARILAEYARPPARTGTDAGVEHLRGMDAVQDRLEHFSHEAVSEVLTFMPGGAQSLPALAAARANDTRLLDRGVELRTIGQGSIRNHRPTLDYARFLTEAGARFRVAPLLPPRMILIDRRSAFMPLDPDDTGKGALHITAAATVASLIALFEKVWATASPLGAERAPDLKGLTDTERAVLTLLGRGLTDEAAATRLSVSPRTIRRTMAELMERLGAASRFEAGLKAAKSGWI